MTEKVNFRIIQVNDLEPHLEVDTSFKHSPVRKVMNGKPLWMPLDDREREYRPYNSAKPYPGAPVEVWIKYFKEVAQLYVKYNFPKTKVIAEFSIDV